MEADPEGGQSSLETVSAAVAAKIEFIQTISSDEGSDRTGSDSFQMQGSYSS